MTVIASKYLSALGSIVPFLPALLLLLIAFLPACDSGSEQRSMSEEAFEQVYGDILFLGELYRDQPAERERVLDSVMQHHGLDTTMLFRTAERYASRDYDAAQLHDVLLDRFEQVARRDSAARAQGDSLLQGSDDSIVTEE